MKMKKKKIVKGIVVLFYMLVALMVIIGEYQKDITLLKFTKPFLIPLLSISYFLRSKKINWSYIMALVFIWLANILFIYQTEPFIFKGAVSYLIFWIIITFIILVNTRFPDKFSFLIALIPFSFIYCCVLQLILETVNESLLMFFLNGVFMTFLGAYSLANYFIDSNKANTCLLISILMFTFIQFLVSIDLYYLSMKLFRPIAMLLFAFAHYFLLKTLLFYEENKLNNNASALV
ncbi:hypothetical protein LZZ90_10955 [Flavobacterium sp. SM15]|uniref:hypothetical protein n=1 Tax=Flavobacterium sp. SM15 TaxID=2908005 RepID=UPI001EDC72CA|nr:hypothetical protein [Flavobacterium sp. SM15]MCG2612026.1 hypothetical protein [Flavobacterium sp. SM15]